SNETINNIEYTNMDNNYQEENDDATKFLMMLHKQIVPSPNFLNIVEQFVSAVESALKSCSEQLQAFTKLTTDENPSTSETSTLV
ncbi:unnamed protein product, partial [Adineta steineri]